MSESGQETAEEFMAIGRYDWYVTGHGRSGARLHYVRPESFTDEHKADMVDNWCVLTPVRLACGRLVKEVHIPGLFSRMSLMRCKQCCRVMKMPQGRQSPKNDAECRKLLGLKVDSIEDDEPRRFARH